MTQSLPFRLFVASHWTSPGTSGETLREMYDRIIHHLQAEKEKTPQKVELKPFLKTGLGGLAPEVREMIFTNLLATPPPYGGRDFRAQQDPIVGRFPTSLKTFVDLKASYLPVLQTCRQVYLEAFPIFYSRKSYYLTNSVHLATFLKFDGYRQVGPERFRFDAITSLCLGNIVVNKPMWNPQSIDRLMARFPGLDRVALEAEQSTKLDSKLWIADLGKMDSLRKICLCMRVGDEWEYLRFLFQISGLGRGVIDFVDNVHWIIHSQNSIGDDWNLQYSAFPNEFYKRGKHFEELSFHDVEIQGEVLNIESRASDLVQGDERWVEVEIGLRNYEDRPPVRQRGPDVTQNQATDNQQELPGRENVDAPEDDGSGLGSEDLLGPMDSDEDSTSTDNEPDQGSDDLEGQPIVENAREETSDYPQNWVNGDNHNPQAESGTSQQAGILHDPSNETYIGGSAEALPEEEPEERHGLLSPVTPTVAAANQRLEALVASPDDNLAYVQQQTDSHQIATMTPDGGNSDDLENRPGDETEAMTQLPSYQNRTDTRMQTEPAASKYRNIQIRTEPGVFAEDSQSETQTATTLKPDQGPGYQTKVRDGPRVSSEGFQASTNSQLRNDLAIKSLQERQILPSSRKKRYLHGFVRAAALIFALSLLYVVLYAKMKNTLIQLLALLLFVPMFFIAHWSESD